MSGSNSWVGVAVPGTTPGQEPRVGELVVAPGYFGALGTPLLHGRDFERTDAREAAPVAIVNQAMAELLWPGKPALGQSFVIGRADAKKPPVQVVGVTADVRHRGRARAVRPEMFLPLAQHPTREMVLVLRTAGAPMMAAAAAEAAIHAVDPTQAVANPRPLTAVLGEDLRSAGLLAALTAAFAVTALLLAALGVHGVVSFTVAQGTREIGIRMALGAGAGGVLRLVLGRFLSLACAGLGLGLVGGLLLGHAASSLLFGVTPQDPVTALLVAALLLGVVALATLVPASRAVRLAPMLALKCD
jgi:predicted permease